MIELSQKVEPKSNHKNLRINPSLTAYIFHFKYIIHDIFNIYNIFIHDLNCRKKSHRTNDVSHTCTLFISGIHV